MPSHVGIRTSMSTTSGAGLERRRRPPPRRPPPRRRPRGRARQSSTIRRPTRTIAWSSTSTTRIGRSSGLLQREAGARPEAALGPRPGLHRAPPNIGARSRMPSRPWPPPPFDGAGADGAVVPTWTMSAAASRRSRHRGRPLPAWRSTLLSASWRPGTRRRRAPAAAPAARRAPRARTGRPAARTSSSSSGTRQTGGAAETPALSRSTPTSPRSSSTDWRPSRSTPRSTSRPARRTDRGPQRAELQDHHAHRVRHGVVHVAGDPGPFLRTAVASATSRSASSRAASRPRCSARCQAPAGEQADAHDAPEQQAEEEVLPRLGRRTPQQDPEGGQHLVGGGAIHDRRSGHWLPAYPVDSSSANSWAPFGPSRPSPEPTGKVTPTTTAAPSGDQGATSPASATSAEDGGRRRQTRARPSRRNSTTPDDSTTAAPTHGTAARRRNGGHGGPPDDGSGRRPAEIGTRSTPGVHRAGDIRVPPLSAGRRTEVEPAEGSRRPGRRFIAFWRQHTPTPREAPTVTTVVPSHSAERSTRRRRREPRAADPDPPRRWGAPPGHRRLRGPASPPARSPPATTAPATSSCSAASPG